MSGLKRVAVTALAVSGAWLINVAVSEGWVGTAEIPTQNDRPTVGFGSTFHEDGSPVRLGDKLDPVRSLITLKAHVDREEAAFRRSLEGAHLHQDEYDVYMDWVYQYGTGAWASSSMRRKILDEDYEGACNALLAYRYITTSRPTAGWTAYRFNGAGKPTRWKFDCSTPGNRVCRGVWTRQVERHAKCITAGAGAE